MIIEQLVRAEPRGQINGYGQQLIELIMIICCAPIEQCLKQYDLLVSSTVTVGIKMPNSKVEITQYPFARIFRNINGPTVEFEFTVLGNVENIVLIESEAEGIFVNKI